MSDTTTDAVRTLRAAPVPEPLTQLTGAPAAIYTELTSLIEAATTAELALAAGLGRSTTGKALTTLEQHGLAVRTPGGHDGPRRTPDRWRAAPTAENSGDSTTDQEPSLTETEPSHPKERDTDAPKTGSTNANPGAAPGGTSASHGNSPDPVTAPVADASQDADHSKAGGNSENEPPTTGGSDNPTGRVLPASQGDGEQQSTPTEAIILPGGRQRLAPGALRQMVIAHLQAHPGEAFTATKISRVIEKSSGAIANALATLTRQGIAEQVTDQPRTYRLAEPEGTR
ncbi:hypothetical protein ACFWZ2_37615 [Streptomyces sp. NPDC059002]|uniref:hypothetical protein n=1 Tax=Streptomyces sp. NPDC059002 TaxID=3346690 RepID=UPI00369A3047